MRSGQAGNTLQMNAAPRQAILQELQAKRKGRNLSRTNIAAIRQFAIGED